MLKTSQSAVVSGLFAVLISGCAGSDVQYPPLTLRDAETLMGVATPDAATASEPLTADFQAQIAESLSGAQAAHLRFMETEASARRLVRAASGTGQESDLRARALVAIAQLSTLRGQTSIALGSLDQLAGQAATQSFDSRDIATAQSEVETILATQSQTIDSLDAALR